MGPPHEATAIPLHQMPIPRAHKFLSHPSNKAADKTRAGLSGPPLRQWPTRFPSSDTRPGVFPVTPFITRARDLPHLQGPAEPEGGLGGLENGYQRGLTPPSRADIGSCGNV